MIDITWHNLWKTKCTTVREKPRRCEDRFPMGAATCREDRTESLTLGLASNHQQLFEGLQSLIPSTSFFISSENCILKSGIGVPER